MPLKSSTLAREASRLTFHVLYLERARGFEPLTTCLGSKDSTTELRPLAESNPTLAPEPSQSSMVIGQAGRKLGGSSHKRTAPLTFLRPQFHQRKLLSANFQAIGRIGYKCQGCVVNFQPAANITAAGSTTRG